MNSEIKNCQNCKKDFKIEPDDFLFYKKIKVPPPTFCPECRKSRIMSFVNMRSLYKRDCNLCNKPIVTMYHSTDIAPIYCNECWQSDNWDASIYAQEIDLNIPFFKQWNTLYKNVPRPALRRVQMIDSEYTNMSVQGNHCYFGYSIFNSEYINYSENIDYSKNCHDCLCIKNNEWCYENIDSMKNYNSCYLSESKSCINSFFLFDCVNCQDCFMGSNLRNKRYVFRGQQLSKEKYIEKIKNENIGSYFYIQELKREFNLLKMNSLHKYADITNSINVTGNHVINSKNVKNSYFTTDGENVSESMRTPGVKDLSDCIYIAGSEFLYSSAACSLGSYHLRNTMYSNGSKNSDYSFLCINCDNVFGCVGLKNKQYCIFNRQYTKDEYFELIEEIKNNMQLHPYIDKIGRIYTYGEFFPSELSPFSYNETVARDFFPLSEEEVFKQGFIPLEIKKRSYNITKTANDLPDNINEVSEDIINEVIECGHKGECYDQCNIAFRILKDDLQFYKKMNIPLPRLCPNCRHYDRLLYRLPSKLWHRQCMCDKKNHDHEDKCRIEFETSYAPDKPEIVYCEKCYQKEVY